jgi:hypothetical protein
MFSLTTEQLRTMDRFELIATWLVGVTRRKAALEYSGGLRVRKARGQYTVTMPAVGDGKAAMFRGDASKLYDYVRRSPLNELVRDVERAREQAHAAPM